MRPLKLDPSRPPHVHYPIYGILHDLTVGKNRYPLTVDLFNQYQPVSFMTSQLEKILPPVNHRLVSRLTGCRRGRDPPNQRKKEPECHSTLFFAVHQTCVIFLCLLCGNCQLCPAKKIKKNIDWYIGRSYRNVTIPVRRCTPSETAKFMRVHRKRP
jgi:hypothetical protein